MPDRPPGPDSLTASAGRTTIVANATICKGGILLPPASSIREGRREMMLNLPMHRLIPKMAVPTIVSMLITSIYSLADTYFVSYLGTSATAAVASTFRSTI